jgi:pyruvate/2-oxoglutarate/acetoin dehydrogenase E1 component
MTTYGTAIRDGFEYLLANYPNVFAIGQGLWSPWYVGNTMTDLDTQFGRDRVIDTPVSELACTGAALGAALSGYRPIMVHPRVDFMLLAADQIVTQAAKWRSMFGGRVSAPVTVRAIINRGGEQGAQHSQSLYSWFAHIPGLRVVMPSTPADARDLLIASVLCDDPVLYLDDRWLYGLEDEPGPIRELDLSREGPRVSRRGGDLTLVGCGYSALLCRDAASRLSARGIECDVIDLRVLNPLDSRALIESVRCTGRLLAVDGDWSSCGVAAEVIAAVVEAVEPTRLRARPVRITLPDAPAPTSAPLERIYYPTVDDVVGRALTMIGHFEEAE